MKLFDKILLILILFTTNFLISQAPSQFTYQSVVRTNSGSLVSNQEVSFRFTILKGTELGSIVFEEEHTVTTNINGLATMIIGKGSGTDDLSEIDWGIDSYFLKVEVDPEGGFNYIAEDTTQLLSVPFALYSNSSGSNLEITGQDYLSLNNNEITVNKIDLSEDVDGILPIANGGTGSSTAPMVAVITALDAAAARNVLGLSSVASSGSYNDLTDRLTAGTNIDITDGVISSTDTNTTYTAGTGISIDGNNAISSTITQYTDANAQAAFTAGTNIDITDGVISSTDTNTTYTAGTGISIDGNNAISTTVTDTDTVRSVTAGGNTLADSETLAFTAGTNVTITENAGAVTISSTDTNTTYTAGTGISIDGNNAISTTVTDTDTERSVTAGGNTLADSETLAFTAGTNVTITENAGAVTISSTDTNTTYSVGDGGLTQNNFTDALKSKLDDLNTSAIYDNSGSPALETGITAAEIRSLISVDVAGTDNSTEVTLTGSYDYLTLSGQTITLDQIDYNTDISNLPSLLQIGTLSTNALAGNTTLSIAGSIGGGSVALSDETLRVVGTLNEVETSASNQTITVGLPSSVNVNLVGDVTGSLTGNQVVVNNTSTKQIVDQNKSINTSGGTVTINAISGRFRISSGSSVRVNNSYVDSNSVIICTIASSPSTLLYISEVSASTDYFDVTLNGTVSGNMDINFLVIN